MSVDTARLFSVHSDQYAAARPHYPTALFDFLFSQCPSLDRAWDCGTGSGQSAVALAQRFTVVEATDVSPEQIANAAPHERVRYSVQAAERTDFPDAYFDLVTVAQALHWFDFDRYWPEVHRILKPEGIFAAWSYAMPVVSTVVDGVVLTRLREVVKPYWVPQLRLAWEGYRSVPFPFTEIVVPPIRMTLSWNFDQFIAYLATWSATRLCRDANGPAFFDAFVQALAPVWGERSTVMPVTMEFFCRTGRVER